MAFQIGQRVVVKTPRSTYEGTIALVILPNHNPFIEVRRHLGRVQLRNITAPRDEYLPLRDTESYIVRGSYRGLPVYYWPYVKDIRLAHG